MKIKTSELTGAALDWAVAKCENVPVIYGLWNSLWVCDRNVFGEDRHVEGDNGTTYHPSRNWSQGGPIIEREGIETCRLNNGEWRGQLYVRELDNMHRYYGPTPLIAACRCFVMSKLGDEVDVPEELT